MNMTLSRKKIETIRKADRKYIQAWLDFCDLKITYDEYDTIMKTLPATGN